MCDIVVDFDVVVTLWCDIIGLCFYKKNRVFFTLFPKITQVCVKVNCYTILCKIDEVLHKVV